MMLAIKNQFVSGAEMTCFSRGNNTGGFWCCASDRFIGLLSEMSGVLWCVLWWWAWAMLWSPIEGGTHAK